MSRNINKEIDEFQKKINGYTPGSTFRVHRERPIDLPDVLRIGLFGPTGVGKSALVNSMNFAAMDKNKPGSTWMSIAAEGYTYDTAQTVTREACLIADNIKIVDNRGMIGLGSPYMVKLGYQLGAFLFFLTPFPPFLLLFFIFLFRGGDVRLAQRLLYYYCV